MKKIVILLLLFPSIVLAQHGVDYVVGDMTSSNSSNATMEVSDSTVVINVASDTWTHVTNDENDLFSLRSGSKNVTLDSDKLILSKDGVYMFIYRLSLTTSTAEALKIGVAKNTIASIYGDVPLSSSSTKDTYIGVGE